MASEISCFCCKSKIDTSPFANMNAAGEPTVSKVNIYDCTVVLCPICTNKLDSFLIGMRRETEEKEIKAGGKVIDLNKYRRIKQWNK